MNYLNFLRGAFSKPKAQTEVDKEKEAYQNGIGGVLYGDDTYGVRNTPPYMTEEEVQEEIARNKEMYKDYIGSTLSDRNK